MHLARRPILHSDVFLSFPSPPGPRADASSFCSHSLSSSRPLPSDVASSEDGLGNATSGAGLPMRREVESVDGYGRRGGVRGKEEDKEEELGDRSKRVGQQDSPATAGRMEPLMKRRRRGKDEATTVEVSEEGAEEGSEEETQLDWHVAGLMLRALQSTEEKVRRTCFLRPTDRQ